MRPSPAVSTAPRGERVLVSYSGQQALLTCGWKPGDLYAIVHNPGQEVYPYSVAIDRLGRWCPACEVWWYQSEHVCVTYSGPPCKTCGKPTVVASIGAPGYGTVRSCCDGHREELTPCGILTPDDVR